MRGTRGTKGTKGEAANKLVEIYIKIREQICFRSDNRVSDRKTSLRSLHEFENIFHKDFISNFASSLAYRLTRRSITL